MNETSDCTLAPFHGCILRPNHANERKVSHRLPTPKSACKRLRGSVWIKRRWGLETSSFQLSSDPPSAAHLAVRSESCVSPSQLSDRSCVCGEGSRIMLIIDDSTRRRVWTAIAEADICDDHKTTLSPSKVLSLRRAIVSIRLISSSRRSANTRVPHSYSQVVLRMSFGGAKFAFTVHCRARPSTKS